MQLYQLIKQKKPFKSKFLIDRLICANIFMQKPLLKSLFFLSIYKLKIKLKFLL